MRRVLGVTYSAASLVRIAVFARATVCSGCACGDCGAGGKRPSFWLSRPLFSRWHRQGFAGCWRRRSRRRPGRPRIDSAVQSLIRRMAAENLLWGAPRIHGELLKLGITVSERTVSRYLQGRMKAPSQSWRTFLANEFSQLALASTVTSSDEPGDHDVAGAHLCPSVQLRLHATGSRSECRAGSVRRLAPLASTPASWSASCPGSRAPPHGPPPTDKTRGSRALCATDWPSCNILNLKDFYGLRPGRLHHAATTYRAVGIVGCGPPQITSC